MTEAPPRAATPPMQGGARDTIPGAISSALVAYLITRDDVSPELAILIGSLCAGVFTFARKVYTDFLYERKQRAD